MCNSNILRTSYFSLAAQFVHLIEDYCATLDARPRITKCDAIKASLLKGLIKRVAAIALIVIASLDLLIELGATLCCKGRHARNIIATIATIFKSVAGIFTGQLPGVAYELYKEGFEGAFKEMVVEPLINDLRLRLYDRFANQRSPSRHTPRSLGKCTRNLARILKHMPVTTETRERRILSVPIQELVWLHNPSLYPMIQLLMKHQRGVNAIAQNVLPHQEGVNFDIDQWTELLNTILGQDVSNDDIWRLLDQIGAPYREGNYSQRNMLVCSLVNKALANRDLDARIANRIILYSKNRLVREHSLGVIEETTNRLINHPRVTPELLNQLAESQKIPTTIKERILNKYLDIALSTPPETPINALIVEMTFRLCMTLPLGDSILQRVQEFHKKYQRQVVSLIHNYADNYLIEGRDGSGFRPETVRMLLKMLINQDPALTEREILAIFKAAAVILDYSFIKEILKNPARRCFCENDFMIAIDQGLQNILRHKDESILQLLQSIPESGLNLPDKLLQLRRLLEATGNTAHVMNWIADNYAQLTADTREEILKMCDEVDKAISEKERKDKTPSTLLSFQKLYRRDLADIAVESEIKALKDKTPSILLRSDSTNVGVQTAVATDALGIIADYYSPITSEKSLSAEEKQKAAVSFTRYCQTWESDFEQIRKESKARMEAIEKRCEAHMAERAEERKRYWAEAREQHQQREWKAVAAAVPEDPDKYYDAHLARTRARSHNLDKAANMSRLFDLALQKSELDEREIQRHIKSLEGIHIGQPEDIQRIKNCVLKLIDHPKVREEWLCDIIQSPICSQTFLYLCCTRLLKLPSLSRRAVEIVFPFCMKLEKGDYFLTLNNAEMREFFIRSREQVATYLDAFADEYLGAGKDSSEFYRENVRTVISTLVGFHPLNEREIKAIFKAAVVLCDYSLVEKIVESPARREFLDKEYVLATYRAFEIGTEEAPVELLGRLFKYIGLLNQSQTPYELATDPFILESKLRLKDYLTITKNTAPARAWLARRNHTGFVYVKEIRLAMEICNICQEIEAREERESKQEIDSVKEGECKLEIETKRSSENDVETFRKKFFGLVLKYGVALPPALPRPVAVSGSASVAFPLSEPTKQKEESPLQGSK